MKSNKSKEKRLIYEPSSSLEEETTTNEDVAYEDETSSDIPSQFRGLKAYQNASHFRVSTNISTDAKPES